MAKTVTDRACDPTTIPEQTHCGGAVLHITLHITLQQPHELGFGSTIKLHP